MYITESHYNSTIWVRAIASRRSSTTNNSGPMYGVFLPVVISTLIRTSYVGSPLFQGSIIYNPSSSCSPTPLLASNHLFIVWNRWWHVTKYPAAAIPVNYPPTHTSTNRQITWSYIHIFNRIQLANIHFFETSERVCANLHAGSLREINKILRLVFWLAYTEIYTQDTCSLKMPHHNF